MSKKKKAKKPNRFVVKGSDLQITKLGKRGPSAGRKKTK